MSGALGAEALVAEEAGPPEARPDLGDGQRLLAELYRAESPRLVRILTRRTEGRDEAQDLVQEIFFRLARMGEKLPASLERPQAYLRRIAANLVKDRAKARRRHSAALHVAAEEEALAGPDPHRLLESRDMLNRLEAAMMRLRPRTREIFMAHRVQGRSYAEIAELTGISVKGVEKQMSKALVQLDALLDRS